jgi:GNAT superfamily N-acetyltransferase
MEKLNILFPNPIVCRPALPIDAPGMHELTRHIWEGEDYVPHAWADWMVDPEGVLAVAESKAKVVGLGKLTKLSETEWWLEGLRVHPDYEGRGIASRLNDYLLAFWQRTGSGVIRLATISKREPVQHMVTKRGFKLIGEFSTYKMPLTNSDDSKIVELRFEPLVPTEISAAVDWLRAPGEDRLPFGVIDLGWQFAKPRFEYIENYVEKNQIWWWKGQRGLLVLVVKKEGSEVWARIRNLACNREDYLACLLDAHTLARRQGFAGLTWKAPLLPGIEQELSTAGFSRDKDLTLLIYEKNNPEY